jgi:hypothetical protein
MDLHLGTLKAVLFCLLHNVSTLNRCRKLSCVTVVCTHFASYQGYPNYRWDLVRYSKGKWEAEWALSPSEGEAQLLPLSGVKK